MDITVVTPTYNRASLLPRSTTACERRRSNFEWLIVDDRSTHHTRELVEGW